MFSIPDALGLLRNAVENEEVNQDLPCLKDAARALVDEEFPVLDRPIISSNLRSATKPALKSLTRPLLSELRAVLHANPEDPHLERWANKLLRVCEVRKSSLRERLATESKDSEQIKRKALNLACFLLEYFEQKGDARFVNFVLKLLEQNWLSNPDKALRLAASTARPNALLSLACYVLLEKTLHTIQTEEFKPKILVDQSAYVKPINTYQPVECTKSKSVVIFSPSRFSLLTMVVTEMLRRNGVKVDAVIVRKLFNPKRAILEFRRDGLRLIRKVWQKLVLKRRAYQDVPFYTMPELLTSLEIQDKSVDALAARHQIPVIYCKTLNDEIVHKHLKSIGPDNVIFTGGGILREKTLALAGQGVINCHMGQLPNYRGMDVVEWPLLENQIEALGFTVHFMERGIDTGDILAVFPMDTSLTPSIKLLRGKFETHMCCSFVHVVTRFLNGQCERHSQAAKDGKQYFIIHERLRRIAESRL